MEISLKNRKSLVGGSSKGLGKAIAMQLAACGSEVTLMARNEEKLQKAVKELPANEGQKHGYLVVDYTDFARFQSVVSRWFENNEADILVNNTNGPAAGGVFDKTEEDYQQSFDLLFKTVNFLTMKVLSGMRRKQFGRIINLSSITTKEPLPNLVLSNSIRSAVLSWAKTLSFAIAAEGITVNNILTGYFETERLKEVYEQQANSKGIPLAEFKESMKAGIPAGRFGKPEEFGHLVAFLASEYSSYITGVNIPIDGGFLRSV